MAEQTKTRHEQVYQSLRGDILAGRLQPGQKLPFADLSTRYGFSVGVIREALSRLVEQGLVENAPQQGYCVTPISEVDLRNLTQARCEIETLTLRHAISEGDIDWQSQVLASHHRLANTPMMEADDPERFSEEWAEAHRVFHETLLEGCDNPRLTNVATQLRASAELYRRWTAPLPEGKTRDVAAEHQNIVNAVMDRNSELAVKLLNDHISLTTTILLESRSHELSDSNSVPA
ncbi:DNA-binding GntR family transcriptional regulator [Aurantimicrobium minutum]|uniref:GntR family transcriptional regulator n=1 Tax=Aurantimicrobium minutum TaxID=708131 RepID=UPI002473C3A3|nr:GntR family transcriptional regulator [Aurantimicrobium minutum]MDH6424276.1 DNA-binding GntR family transcriptional regulator [Aurantimicrobium minutum]